MDEPPSSGIGNGCDVILGCGWLVLIFYCLRTELGCSLAFEAIVELFIRFVVTFKRPDENRLVPRIDVLGNGL